MISSDFDKGGAATGPRPGAFDYGSRAGWYQDDQYEGLMWLFLGLM